MKITQGETIITDVPGIKSVTIRSDGGDGLPVIIIDHGTSVPNEQHWEAGPLAEYRDALTKAIEIANGGHEARIPRTPRVFKKGDGLPPDYETINVLDDDGDRWRYSISRIAWISRSTATTYKWNGLLDAFGPLTEIVDSVPDLAREPRVFREFDAQPSDVEAVRDADGDIWKISKSAQTWFLGDDDGDGLSWGGLVSRFGPLTEITEP